MFLLPSTPLSKQGLAMSLVDKFVDLILSEQDLCDSMMGMIRGGYP